ncbi:hypothetical protein Tco_0995631, partial [Tanacetum coccineum]
MVSYLKKPTRSEGFQEIVDFLNGSHIRYALTKNPTIYVSLIENFWQTATVRTVDNREQEITATVDGKEFTITEAFVRRHLQLADVDEEGEGSGNPSKPQPPPSTAQPTYEEQIPITESSSPQNTQSPRQAIQEDTQLPQTSVPIPNVADEAVFKKRDDRVVRATTTAARLDAAHASGNILKTQSTAMPNVPLPQEIGAGGSPRCQEATRGSIAQEITHLKVYGAAYTKLILKVKKLERIVKTSQAKRRAKIVISNDDMASEDSFKLGRMIEDIDLAAGTSLVQPHVAVRERQSEDDTFNLEEAFPLPSDAVKKF